MVKKKHKQMIVYVNSCTCKIMRSSKVNAKNAGSGWQLKNKIPVRERVKIAEKIFVLANRVMASINKD